MTFVLTLEDRRTGRQTRSLDRGTISIGRATGNDWVLEDPDRQLSKTHCVVSIEGTRAVLTDLSTNGVFVNGAREPVGRDGRVVLTDGCSFRLGDYTITVEERQGAPAPAAALPGDADPLGGDLLDDPFGVDPAAPPFVHPVAHVPPPARFEDPFDSAPTPRRAAALDRDPFAVAAPLDDWTGPTQPDHAAAPCHAFETPRPMFAASFDELDFDALLGDIPPGPPGLATPPHATSRPAPPIASTPESSPFETIPPATPASGARLEAPKPAPVQAGAAASSAAALAAFLDGAGVPDLRVPGDPDAALRAAGAILRAMVEGLREVLMSRSAIKNELRVEQTMLRQRDNNALKFSVTVEEALAALLLPNRTGYKPPLDAAREAYADVRIHEMEVMAGVQTALLALLKRFDPEALEARLQPTRLDILPGARRARIWELFCATYGQIAREAEDDFQSVFGREFARAYDAQVKKL